MLEKRGRSRVGGVEVGGDGEGVGDGAVGIGVVNDGERVAGATVGVGAGGWRTDAETDIGDVGNLDPDCAEGEALVAERVSDTPCDGGIGADFGLNIVQQNLYMRCLRTRSTVTLRLGDEWP